MASLYSAIYLAGSKKSQTVLVLLYKKEDPLSIENHRPIALADTLIKLYTGLLTDCMTGMLSTMCMTP